jgi:hypothetical protein
MLVIFNREKSLITHRLTLSNEILNLGMEYSRKYALHKDGFFEDLLLFTILYNITTLSKNLALISEVHTAAVPIFWTIGN